MLSKSSGRFMRPSYRRADTDWFARSGYGISFHWTAQTASLNGPTLPFTEAVEKFDVNRFAEAVKASGAKYVIFTITHAIQHLPFPDEVVDQLLPGRTCERDLIDEIEQKLAQMGVALILYYNHGCNGEDDPKWKTAVGYYAEDKRELVENLCNIVASIGRRYGERLKGWWFDSGYSLDPSGPHDTVTTDMGGFRFRWEKFVEASKDGNRDRIVAINAGVMEDYLYTTNQDYWAGEMVNLESPPTSRFLPCGLQWHGWTCLDDRAWVYAKEGTEMAEPLYSLDTLKNFMQPCLQYTTPMTFNILIDQSGFVNPSSIELLGKLGAELNA